MEVFTQTSHDLYNRHNYKVVYEDGKEVFLNTYEDVQLFWFERGGKFLSHVEVLDKKKQKTKAKGF